MPARTIESARSDTTAALPAGALLASASAPARRQRPRRRRASASNRGGSSQSAANRLRMKRQNRPGYKLTPPRIGSLLNSSDERKLRSPT
eukprot:826625-Pleurochrysis_carterae.AAC.12